MGSVLYITRRGKYNIAAKVHRRALEDIFGADNIVTVDLLKREIRYKNGSVEFGYKITIPVRIFRFAQGNVNTISNRMIMDICRLIKLHDVQIVFSEESDLGNLFKAIKKENKSIILISFFHDISADLFKQRRKHAKWWQAHYKMECTQVIRQERVLQKYIDECWVFNEADSIRYNHYYGSTPDCIIPMATELPVITRDVKNNTVESQDEKKILFVCSDYYVNIEGFMWFYKRVLPYLNRRYTISIVGTGSNLLSDKVVCNRIRIIGPVDDLGEYYKDADIVITPILSGGGMKVKTLEALSYSKLVVGTTESLNGYWEAIPHELRNKIVFRSDDPKEWIEIINKLLEEKLYKHYLELETVFEQHFSYNVMVNRFRKRIEEIKKDII